MLIARFCHHSAFIAWVDVSIIVIQCDPKTRSTGGLKIHKSCCPRRHELFHDQCSIGFAKCNSIVINANDVIETLLIKRQKLFRGIPDFMEVFLCEAIRIKFADENTPKSMAYIFIYNLFSHIKAWPGRCHQCANSVKRITPFDFIKR